MMPYNIRYPASWAKSAYLTGAQKAFFHGHTLHKNG